MAFPIGRFFLFLGFFCFLNNPYTSFNALYANPIQQDEDKENIPPTAPLSNQEIAENYRHHFTIPLTLADTIYTIGENPGQSGFGLLLFLGPIAYITLNPWQ